MNLIKNHEKCRLTCYADLGGIPTIGWGHTLGLSLADVGVKTITQAEADALYDSDVSYFTAELHHIAPNLTDNQFNGLLSFMFNCGRGAFYGDETLIAKHILAGDWAGVFAGMRRYNKVNGVVSSELTKRREEEITLIGLPE